MTVLGIVGSPRKKGNTHILMERVLEGAVSSGAETDIVLLGGLSIGECDGCHACWKGRDCVRCDDMNGLYSRIAAADAIVFGTPVYWYGPTALMKAFLDRFVYFNCPENRPKIRGKKAACVIPFEDEPEETASATLAIFGKSFEWLELENSGSLIVPGVTDRGDVLQKESALKSAYELGQKLAI